MLFRGREMTHVDHGYEIMEEILEIFQEHAKIERPAKMAGRRMTMVITPLK
jgi:translation initiation factor IF-3